jgi:transcriptional regulator with XRE-family HTH domain
MISERIFELLEQQGKRQAALADFIGVRKNTISEWKAKKTSPSSDLLIKIAEFFDVSLDYLLAGKEAPVSIRQGIFGDRNAHNSITINGDAPRTLSEIESELMRICSELDTRKKNALLAFAYELADKE